MHIFRPKTQNEINQVNLKDLDWLPGRNFLLRNTNYFLPKATVYHIFFIFLIVSLFQPKGFRVLIPLLSVYFYNLLSLKILKSQLRFQRKNPEKGKELEQIEIGYSISNPSAFHFHNLTIINNFEGHYNKFQGTHWLKTYESLAANTKKYIKREIKLNHGMGEKKFDDFYLFTTDELGINRLKVTSDDASQINVYPKIHSSKADKIIPDPTSRNFGNFDTYQRGENVNFYGVREYQQGDNIKKINWKLSLKSGDLVVNEFEKNVNGKILIILNEDQRLHMGEGALGTLEYAKDLSLSLAHQHIKNNNEVGFITHQLATKSNAGSGHIQALEMNMGKIKPAKFDRTNLYHRGAKCPQEIKKFMARISANTSSTTTVYFITGFVPGKIYRYYTDFFGAIARKSHRLVILNINGLHQMIKSCEEQDMPAIQMLIGQLNPEESYLKKLSRRHQFEIKHIKVDQSQIYDKTIKEGLQFR